MVGPIGKLKNRSHAPFLDSSRPVLPGPNPFPKSWSG